jgi:predicted DNA-binding antitoxin AbrB/MazE fold protein
MIQHIDAVFENGVFRPEVPLAMQNGQRVSLDIKLKSVLADDLADVVDLLDTAYMESCRQNAQHVPSLEEVRRVLAAFQGSLAEQISEDRDGR